MKKVLRVAAAVSVWAAIGGCSSPPDLPSIAPNTTPETIVCEPPKPCNLVVDSKSVDGGGSGMPLDSARIVSSFVSAEFLSDNRARITLAALVKNVGDKPSAPFDVVFKTLDSAETERKGQPALFILHFEGGLQPGATAVKKGTVLANSQPASLWLLTPVQRSPAK